MSLSSLISIVCPYDMCPYSLNLASLKKTRTLTHSHTFAHRLFRSTRRCWAHHRRWPHHLFWATTMKIFWQTANLWHGSLPWTSLRKRRRRRIRPERTHRHMHTCIFLVVSDGTSYVISYGSLMELIMQFLMDLWCLFWNLSGVKGFCAKRWEQSHGSRESWEGQSAHLHTYISYAMMGFMKCISYGLSYDPMSIWCLVWNPIEVEGCRRDCPWDCWRYQEDCEQRAQQSLSRCDNKSPPRRQQRGESFQYLCVLCIFWSQIVLMFMAVLGIFWLQCLKSLIVS